MNYFEKKQWIRLGICAVVVLAITLLVSGLIGDNLKYNLKEETKAPELPEATGENQFKISKMVYFNGTDDSMGGGEITVLVTVGEGKTVEALEIDASSQTENMGQKTMEESFIGQFVGKAGPFVIGENIDAVSGATRTSEKVVEALNEALEQSAGGESETKAESEGNPEKPAEKDAEADQPKTTETQPSDTKDEAEETPEPTEEPQPKSMYDVEYAYSSEQETNYSIIRVYANAVDGKITECVIISEEKSAGSDFLTDEIKAEWAKAIVENGNADTDAITGATKTLSAKAVTDAVNDILAQASSGDTVNEPETTPVPIMTQEPIPEPTGTPVPLMTREPIQEPTPEPTATPVPEATEEPDNGWATWGSAGTTEEPETTEPPKQEEPAGDSRIIYGSYTAKKETNFSIIRVYINTKGGKITDCRITSEAKSENSDFLTDEIKDAWAKAIVENGTAETDVITGATLSLSSAAVVEAVNDILAQAGGREIVVDKPESVEETTTATTEPEKEDAEKKDEPQRESTGKQVTEVAVDPSRVLYGSYTAKRETDFSVIRVTVNTKGGQITDCRITSEAKSEGSDFLTDEIKDAWAKAIVENGTADTDAITGATLSFSSAAVVEAVNEILAQIR